MEKGSKCKESDPKRTSNCSMLVLKTLFFLQQTNCLVVTKEEMFSTIATSYARVGHSGCDKTWSEVKSNYAGVKHAAIEIFLKTCASCAQHQVVPGLPLGMPMITLSFCPSSPEISTQPIAEASDPLTSNLSLMIIGLLTKVLC